ncbi:MAG: hypothetical protein AAGM22_08960 [Acidobacteriota bacterium]
MSHRLNRKRIFLAGIVVFLAFGVMGIFVHGFWLGATYSSLMGDVWRTAEDLNSKAWIMHSTALLFSFIYAYLFARGYRGGGWKEGLWFGFVAYFFVGFQAVFHAYATYPIPLELALKWFASGLPMSMLLGVLASLVYKPLIEESGAESEMRSGA